MNIIPKKWLSVNLLRKKAHGNQFCKIKEENLEIRRGAACCSRFLLLSNCIFSGGASPSPTIMLMLKLYFFKAPTPFENPKTQQRFEDPS